MKTNILLTNNLPVTVREVTDKKGRTYKALFLGETLLTFDRLAIWRFEHYNEGGSNNA